jgi:hypothetical protein
MKKVFSLMAVLLIIGLFCGAAFAEEVSTVAGGEALPTEPFSWEYLATIAGATVATMLIVQLLKLPLDKVWKIPTRIIVYVIALIISLLATQFTVGLTLQNGLLTAVNAVIVALAAMGGYEITLAKLEKKKE